MGFEAFVTSKCSEVLIGSCLCQGGMDCQHFRDY